MLNLAFRIVFWSDFFISGWGQLQIAVEMLLGITLMIVFFSISIIFFISINKEKYQKLMYIVCTTGGIIIAILIALNFVWQILFGMPILK